jgi:predicted GNAT superfamily acetyltransferase
MPTTETAVSLRPLESPSDFEACVVLQRATWGADFRELVPPALLRIAQHTGGIAAGAFAPPDRLLGFVFGITGWRDRRPVHWSHMLAVAGDARDRGIGRRLKLYQRDRLRDAGVDRMFWTFDPLVARNAHLNLNRLGATVREYVEDMYGHNPMSRTDSVIGSDRFVVEWLLDANAPHPRVEPVDPDAPSIGLEAGTGAALPDAPVVRVEIPGDIQRLKVEAADTALAWRRATRRALQHYLARGYAVRRLARDAAGRGAYVLARDT